MGSSAKWTGQSTVDAVAGFGDSLSLGLSPGYRNCRGIDSVDKCSSAYQKGQIAGAAYGLAVPVSRRAYVTRAKQIPTLGLSAAESAAGFAALGAAVDAGLGYLDGMISQSTDAGDLTSGSVNGIAGAFREHESHWQEAWFGGVVGGGGNQRDAAPRIRPWAGVSYW